MSAILEAMNFADKQPQLSHRFGVFFLDGGLIPNILDIRFQKVSGLNTEVQLETINEGGQNLFAHRLPKKVTYNNLVLERGYIAFTPLEDGIVSPLNLQFIRTFSSFQFHPADVTVMMFNEAGNPIGSWIYFKAYPVRWSVSDLDAQSNTVAIDTMELAYTSFQILRL